MLRTAVQKSATVAARYLAAARAGKTRYRGLVKNRAQLFTLFALANLFLVRRKLMA